MQFASSPERERIVKKILDGEYVTKENATKLLKSLTLVALVWGLDLLASKWLGTTHALAYLYFVPVWYAIKVGGKVLGGVTGFVTTLVVCFSWHNANPGAALFTHLLVFAVLVHAFDHTESRITRANIMAETDALTGLLNHRGFMSKARFCVNHAVKVNDPACVIVLDCDRFKQINDAFGHSAGDRALSVIGLAIRSALQGGDVAGRTGGDEFAIILPDCDELGIAVFLNKVKTEVKRHRIDNFEINLSHGISVVGSDGVTVEGLMQVADRRMLANKANLKAAVEAVQARSRVN